MIYLDHAASTPLDSRVLEAMLPYLKEEYGNPSSICSLGQRAKNALSKARREVAETINCHPREVIFTSGGTESVNLAVKGVADSHKSGHIIISSIEHSSVMRSAEYLENKGFKVTRLEVDKNGLVSATQLKEAIKKDTILISIIYANNEIGSIQNLKALSKIAKEKNIPFHTDACQASGALSIDVQKLGVNLMTLNGSKIYGPKGAGVLYKSETTKLKAQLHGGKQEYNHRSGTENLAGIVGFAKALQIAEKTRQKESKRQTELRNFFIKEALKRIPDTKLNGHKTKRLPNNINLSFKGLEGETIVIRLDSEGICASSGSACLSGSVEPSHVMMALGANYEEAHSSVRFTIGRSTKKSDLKTVLKKLKDVILDLRKNSPLF